MDAQNSLCILDVKVATRLKLRERGAGSVNTDQRIRDAKVAAPLKLARIAADDYMIGSICDVNVAPD